MTKKNKNIFLKEKFKLSLCIQAKILLYENNSYKEIISDLISNMPEIDQIINLENLDVIRFIYSSRKKIEFILYNNEEIIFIHPKLLNKKFSNYFYLSLLIGDNANMINYCYKIDLIKEINKYKNENNNNYLLRKILISKIGIELINNYKEFENYDEKEENYLEKIKFENEIFIKNKIDLFKTINLNYKENDIENKKIDEIYIDIIIGLIKNNKFEDIQNVIIMFNQLDLININLTNLMLTELISFLDSDNEKVKNCAINEQKDLFNIIKVNFFYLLLKYIIKEPIYIYQSKYLIKARINIIKIIKTFDISFKCNDAKDIEKLEWILKILTDSEYYFNLYRHKSNASQTIAEKETDFNEYKKENVERNEELNEEDIKNFIEKILNSSSFIFANDEKGEIFFNILNEDQNNKKINNFKKYKKISKEEKFNILEKNAKKFLEFLHYIKAKIKKEFKFRYNLLIKINFELIDINNNTLFNILCHYYFYPLNKKRLFSFIDENILVSGIDGSLQGFYYLLNEINDSDYEKLIFEKNLDIAKIIKKKDDLEKRLKENKNSEKIFSIYDIGKSSGASEYEIIKLEKVIEQHSNNAEIIKELSNGYYLSSGKSKYIYIYNEKFEKIMEIYSKIYPTNIIEKRSNKNNELKLISYSEEKIILITLKLNILDYYTESFNQSASNIIEISHEDYIINNKKGGFIVQDLFSSSANIIQKTLKYSYKVGLKIDEQNSIFTSNEIIHNGKNRLIIYEMNKNEIKYELEGYSFSLSQNSLLLIENNNNVNNNKILICACKKYDYHKNYFNKNGLLLLNINYNYHQYINDIFYDTGDYEPFCFCPIKLVYNNGVHKKEYKTNYFFVGGFDKAKRLGIIKLYKIIFEYKKEDTRIEFIQDLILGNNKNEDYYRFNGAVTCIVQTKEKGNFLISCTNGKIYLFTSPNINYFLFCDEQEQKDFDYDEIPFYDEKIQKEVNDKQNENKIYNNKIMFNYLLDIYKNESPSNSLGS